jgi:hypothetical protein
MLRGRRPSERAAAHLQLLLAQLPSSFVWTTSDDLRLTSIAGAALSLIGLGDAEAFIGEKLETILAGGRDGGAAIVNAHERALQGESTQLTESTRRWTFDVHVEPLRDGEVIVGAGGIAIDAYRALARGGRLGLPAGRRRNDVAFPSWNCATSRRWTSSRAGSRTRSRSRLRAR